MIEAHIISCEWMLLEKRGYHLEDCLQFRVREQMELIPFPQQISLGGIL